MALTSMLSRNAIRPKCSCGRNLPNGYEMCRDCANNTTWAFARIDAYQDDLDLQAVLRADRIFAVKVA